MHRMLNEISDVIFEILKQKLKKENKMGRTARKVPKGQFKLREVQPGLKSAVYIYYYWQGKQLRRSTDVMVAPGDWNQKSNNGIGELRKSYGNDYSSKNRLLQNRLAEIDKKISEYIDKTGSISWQTIQNFMDGEDVELRPDQGKDFFKFAYERIQRKKELGGKGTSPSNIENQVSYIKQFEKFIKYEHKGTHGVSNELLYVGDITAELVREYRVWRLNDGRKIDTINKGIQAIASVCKYAADLHYITYSDAAAIGDLYLTDRGLESADIDVKYLTQDELQRLAAVKNTLTHDRQKEILEMYMFSFYACGLRLIDILTLQWKDIDYERNRIKKIQVKTLNRNFVPMSDKVKEILERWRGRNDRFVFGLLSESFDLNDREELYRRRNAITHTLNTSIKRSCQKAGIGKEYTFHSARHSWAVYALEKGTEISKISRLLGHSDSKITERIYAEYLPDTLDKVVEDLSFDFG